MGSQTQARQGDAHPGKPLFDPAEEWMQISKRSEPDLAVDGLHQTSLLERVLALFASRRS
jgi:hypothetical protein